MPSIFRKPAWRNADPTAKHTELFRKTVSTIHVSPMPPPPIFQASMLNASQESGRIDPELIDPLWILLTNKTSDISHMRELYQHTGNEKAVGRS